ncbi:FAD-binding and (Fe-S)-binding domain-containing protein [Nocardioides salsibiostraticola]
MTQLSERDQAGQAIAPGDLVAALRRRGVSDVDDSTLARALYSSDSSLYRVVPQAVARPQHVDELDAILDVAREAGVPVTMRGAGTSIAGNAVGPGIVVDTLRHLHRIGPIDAEAGTVEVEPGVVHANLQRAAAPLGWRYGPDPSTHTRCTIGGMIGNNACGSRALGYGRTADTIVDLDVLHPGSGVNHRLAALAEEHLGHIRTSFGTFSRQVSGYSLEHLLPERRSIPRFLAGSEGTLGIVRRATVSLVREEPRDLLVLGYPTMPEAADAVAPLLAMAAAWPDARMIACEGLDSRIVELVRGRGTPVPDLPSGAGWLFVETAGDDRQGLSAALAAGAASLGWRQVTSATEAAALWRIREDGAGLAARSLATPAYSGWEDAAVPPEKLGLWLRDFDDLLREHGLDGVPYGHFGDGCVHVRIDFDFSDGGARFRSFLEEGADRLAAYGGSLSGEHGDGRARSELLPKMYDAESMALFGRVKQICDPENLLNPGVLVDPAPLDADLRPARPRASIDRANAGLRLLHDNGSLADAVHRCTGVGKCVAPTTTGVMCPSFIATREEKDSTRGRARVLQEAMDGELVGGLADPAVHEALDLCLSCKGCSSNCPTGVDIGSYKAEVLHQTYRGKRRPRSHYTLGRLPRLARMAAPMAPLVDKMMALSPMATLAKSVAGIDQRRSLPGFAAKTLRRSVRGESDAGSTDAPDVWIWADSFTDHFAPHTAHAAIKVLAAAGLRARVIDESACCGLTWITTGQLDAARKIVGRSVATLAPYVASGVPVIGLEPSCLAALRSDAVELTDDPRAVEVAAGVLTFAELLSDLPRGKTWTPPDLTGTSVVAQPHCHHSSVMGWEADERLLRDAGAEVVKVAGCCGLAGNFGMEKGHYETSVAIAESYLLPAVRAADQDVVVLADGMSCRVQLDDLADVHGIHLAELFASRL